MTEKTATQFSNENPKGTGWKLPAAFIATVFAVVATAAFMLPEGDMTYPQAGYSSAKEEVYQAPTRWRTPYEQLPNSDYACHLVWKDYAGNLDITVVDLDPVSQTHYGTLYYFSKKTGAKKKETLVGCEYMTSAYGNEVVMIIDGINLDQPGNIRYVWDYNRQGGIVVSMAGGY